MHGDVEPQFRRIQRGIGDAEIQRQTDQRDLADPACAQIAFQPGGRGVVVLEKRGIAVDGRVMPFAEDQIGAIHGQIGVELRAERALDAVVGPEHLRAIGHVDHAHLCRAMGGGEGGMPRRVPILRQDHHAEIIHHGIDPRHDLIAACHGQRAAGAEVFLHIDDDHCMAHGGFPVKVVCPQSAIDLP